MGNVFPTVKYWMDFASEVCFNKIRHKGALMLIRAIKQKRKKEAGDSAAQLKAALLIQKIWRNRGVFTRVVQIKRRACTGDSSFMQVVVLSQLMVPFFLNDSDQQLHFRFFAQ